MNTHAEARNVIAARIGTLITNNPTKIRAAIEAGIQVQWINRRFAQFMASFDLGRNWELLARAGSLFGMDGEVFEK